MCSGILVSLLPTPTFLLFLFILLHIFRDFSNMLNLEGLKFSQKRILRGKQHRAGRQFHDNSSMISSGT